MRTDFYSSQKRRPGVKDSTARLKNVLRRFKEASFASTNIELRDTSCSKIGRSSFFHERLFRDTTSKNPLEVAAIRRGTIGLILKAVNDNRPMLVDVIRAFSAFFIRVYAFVFGGNGNTDARDRIFDQIDKIQVIPRSGCRVSRARARGMRHREDCEARRTGARAWKSTCR